MLSLRCLLSILRCAVSVHLTACVCKHLLVDTIFLAFSRRTHRTFPVLDLLMRKTAHGIYPKWPSLEKHARRRPLLCGDQSLRNSFLSSLQWEAIHSCHRRWYDSIPSIRGNPSQRYWHHSIFAVHGNGPKPAYFENNLINENYCSN